jgi:integrase
MRGGSIYERTNRDGTTSWVVMYRTADGKQIKRTIRGGRRDAEAFLNAELGARARGERRTTSAERFGPYAERWLESRRPRLEPGTYRRYEADLRLRLIPAFGRLRVRQITRAHVEDHVAALQREGRASVKTINNSLLPLHQILGRAVREGLLAANPTAETDRDARIRLPYEAPAMRTLAAGECRRYVDACPHWYRPLAELLLGTGCRIGEALALDWADVDLDAGRVRISRSLKDGGVGGTKGDRARLVALDPYVVEALRTHQRATRRIAGPVFASRTGTRLDRHNVRRSGHDVAIRDAGLAPGLRIHDLRHTAATLAIAAGESISFVQNQLGHRDVRTTQRYAHPDHQSHRHAAARVARAWRAG